MDEHCTLLPITIVVAARSKRTYRPLLLEGNRSFPVRDEPHDIAEKLIGDGSPRETPVIWRLPKDQGGMVLAKSTLEKAQKAIAREQAQAL
jgi:hypothetical protein